MTRQAMWGCDLDHRDLGARFLVAVAVHHPGGLQGQQPRLLDHDARLGDPLLRHGLVGDARAKGDTARRAPAHPFEWPLGEPDKSDAMVNPARSEQALGDLEPAAFAVQHVCRRHPYIVAHHLGMAMRRLVIAKDRQHAFDDDPPYAAPAPGLSTAGGSGPSCPGPTGPLRSGSCSARRAPHWSMPQPTTWTYEIIPNFQCEATTSIAAMPPLNGQKQWSRTAA